MLTIGEFSHVTRLTVKALRIYHDAGLLVPEKVDSSNGYRYYGDESFKKAEAIGLLRELGFSVKEMTEILGTCRDDAELVGFFRKRLEAVESDLERTRKIRDSIHYFIEKERGEFVEGNFAIAEKNLEAMTICSVRYRGRYSDFGTHFGLLYKKAGRWAKGAPFSLHHDLEYKEEADIEVAVEVRRAVSAEGIECRVLAGGKAVTLRYRGPYGQIGEAYKRLFDYLKEKGYEAKLPAREAYLKGPGMILPRSPKNFITELQIFV